MAGNGPPPAERRRRNNKDTYADVQATISAEVDKLRGPNPGSTWLPETQRWYQTWRMAPQSELFLATDWQRLLMMLPLVDDYFERPHHLKLSEIRLNESLLGATHVDRLKGRIKVEAKPQTAAAPGVTALDDYRARLAG